MLRFIINLRWSRCIQLVLLLAATWNAASAAEKPKIELKGGSESLRENIKQFLPLYDESCTASRWRLRSQLRDATQQITSAAQALGYYHLTFEHELTQGEKCWSMVITLTPGEPVRVSELRLVINGEGANDRVFQPLLDEPGIKQGDRLNHGRYESLKSRFGSIASSYGYFDGKFQLSRVSVDTKNNSAVIELIYDSGPRYRFGEIRLKQDILNDDFVKRYINIQEGDYYETEKLLLLKTMYNASNFFSLASVSPDLQNTEDGKVPIDIVLDPRKRYSYSVGAGVATDTGPRLLFGFEDRYFNARGHSIAADLNLSEIKSTFETAYTIPMTRPAHEFLKIYYGYEREDTEVSISSLHKIGTSYTRLEENKWLFTYALSYELENSGAGSEEQKRTHLLIPSASVSRSKAEGNPTYPSGGWNLLARVSGSPEALGSDFSFLQFKGRAKYIHSLGKGRLLLRGEVGATEVSDITELPVSVRFFAGGDASVRGYDYNSLGPDDPDDNEGLVRGGDSLLVGSLEYDRLIKPNWALAAFYDIGNAGDNFDFEFKRGVGLGVRWISPIGPVRIDIAKALDDEKAWALHLTMGPDL